MSYPKNKAIKASRYISLIIYLVPIIFLGFKANGQVSAKDSILQVITAKRVQKNFSAQDTVYITSLIELSKELRYYNQDSLKILAEQALDLSAKSNFNQGLINAHLQLGNYYSDSGKHDQAIRNFESAKYLAGETGDSYLLARALDYLAGEYGFKGNSSLALQYFLKAIEVAEGADDKKMLSIINENIANLYFAHNDFEQSLFYFEKVKKINREIGNPIYMAETLSNLASVQAEMGDLENAMYSVNTCIKTFEENKIMDWLAYAYEIKGKIYVKKSKYDWAMYWYEQSKLLHTDLEDDRAEISLLNGMAKASLHLNKDSISEVYALRAFEISDRLVAMDGQQECSETLYELMKKKGDYKSALYFHEIYQRLTDTLTRKENQKGLTMLKTKVEYDQQKEQLIMENEKALAKQKMYVYLSLFVLAIVFVIAVLIRRSEKIQKAFIKELRSNREHLKKREEHLKNANATKDKLFSIIGHDLRGPIGAFQGLLKMFKDGEMTQEEFLGFLPKLKSDIDHIYFTLNNLLSWGHTQMNGFVTKPKITCLDFIIDENIALLDEIAHSKAIKLVNRIEPNTMIWSDSDQIDIVVRNLLSNALKFTPNNGMITIGAIEKTKHFEVYVRDNGIGMTQEVMEKIFKKDSSHTTYGTNNEKGTGLGLNLCKEMVESNRGKIWVNSAPNKGTSFYFTVPKAAKEYKKTG